MEAWLGARSVDHEQANLVLAARERGVWRERREVDAAADVVGLGERGDAAVDRDGERLPVGDAGELPHERGRNRPDRFAERAEEPTPGGVHDCLAAGLSKDSKGLDAPPEEAAVAAGREDAVPIAGSERGHLALAGLVASGERARERRRDVPDADLVALAQQGRDAAYRELIRRYERPVFSLVYRMVRDRELAEDLTQDTFIRVLNHIDRYRPEFKFSSWLFKIANNVAIDHLRRRHLDTVSMEGSPHAATPEAVEATSFEVPGQQESALDELEAKELGGAIEAAIARLRPEYRACILLRHVEGRPYEEIAGILDLPLGTVKTYIHRARNELRQMLAHLRD